MGASAGTDYCAVPLYTIFGKNGDHLPVNANDNLRIVI